MSTEGPFLDDYLSKNICRCAIIPYLYADVEAALQNNDLAAAQEMVHYMHGYGDGIRINLRISKCAEIAAKNGNLNMLKWLVDDCRWVVNDKTRATIAIAYSKALYIAAKNGHFQIVKWLSYICMQYNHSTDIIESAIYSAAINDHLEIAQYLLRDYEIKLSQGTIDDIINRSASRGYANVVKWLYEFQSIESHKSSSLLKSIIESGDIELFKWAFGHWLALQASATQAASKEVSELMSTAICHGKVEIAKWIWEINDKIDLSMISFGTKYCKTIDMYHWLHDEMGVELTISEEAFRYGNLDVAKYIIRHDHFNHICALSAIILTAIRGELEIAEWLTTTPQFVICMDKLCNLDSTFKCPLHPNKIDQCQLDAIIKNGEVRVLEFLKKTFGCKLQYKKPMKIAAVSGKLDTMKWLLTEGHKCTKKTISIVINNCSVQFDAEIIQWLFEIVKPIVSYSDGIKWMYDAARSGNLDALLFLHEKGCKINTSTIRYAIESGNIEMLEWLKSKYCEVFEFIH